jgi:hypothetical protein
MRSSLFLGKASAFIISSDDVIMVISGCHERSQSERIILV